MKVLTFCFLFFSLISAYASYNSKNLFGFIAYSSVFLFLFSFTWGIDFQIAQDLPSYYLWYQESSIRLYNESDPFFSYLLVAFPDNLSIEVFSFFLLFAILLPLLILLNKFKIIYSLTWEHLALIAIVLCADRLFFDLSLNTSRSSIAIILFCLGFVSTNFITKIILIILAIGFHLYASLFLFLIVIIYKLVEPNKKIIFFLGIMSCLFFTMKYFFAISFFSDSLTALVLNERLTRGTQLSDLALTASLFIQIFISILLLIVVNFFQYFRENNSHIEHDHNTRKIDIQNIGIIIGSAVLILYPDLILILRFAIVPMLFLLPSININILRILALFKCLLMAYILI